MGTTNHNDLEKRIAAALTSHSGAPELAALVEETEAAMLAAEETALALRERSKDILAAPDAAEAHQAAFVASLVSERLTAACDRLKTKYATVLVEETNARWLAKAEQIKAEGASLAAEFSETYPEVLHKLVDLFARMRDNDKAIDQLHSIRPGGCSSIYLYKSEIVARELTTFTINMPSILEAARLPNFADGSMAWPPPQPSLAVLMATSMVPQYDARFSADWAAAREADNVRRQQNVARWREEEAARQELSRQVYEASLTR